MPQVDFYILQTDSLAARWEFLARLLGKVQALGKSACIAVDSEANARQLDQLLWTVPQESFLPHAIVSAGETVDENTIIAVRPETSHARDVLVNLRGEPPTCHREPERLVEVLVQDPDILRAGRANFRFYRHQGYQAKSHHIDS